MKKILLLLAILAFVLFPNAPVQAQDEPKAPTMWVDEKGNFFGGTDYVSPQETWRLSKPEESLQVESMEVAPDNESFRKKRAPDKKKDSKREIVIVPSEIFQSWHGRMGMIKLALAIKLDGFNPDVQKYTQGSAEELRKHLISTFNKKGLRSVALIGDIPAATFETTYDWYGYASYPTDFFYGDMTGKWEDIGYGYTVAGNGLYDRWDDPDHQLEISVGRIPTNITGMTPGEVLYNYAEKRLKQALRRLNTSTSSLVYVDDDWGNMGIEDAYNVGNVFGVENVFLSMDTSPDGDICTAGDYRDYQMHQDYQIVSVRSHGNPDGHGFFENYRNSFGFVYGSDYLSINPRATLYSLFVCSAANFLYDDCLAARIVAKEDYSLAVISSTKTGGMWYREDLLYAALGEGRSVGDGFKDWFNNLNANFDDNTQDMWFGGQVIIGDPSVRLK